MSADIEKVGPQDGLAVQQALRPVEDEKTGSDSSRDRVSDGDVKKGDGKDQKEQDKEDGVGGFGAYVVWTSPSRTL